MIPNRAFRVEFLTTETGKPRIQIYHGPAGNIPRMVLNGVEELIEFRNYLSSEIERYRGHQGLPREGE